MSSDSTQPIARRATGVDPPIYQGFEARRELVTEGGLVDYRILHFATHGVVDTAELMTRFYRHLLVEGRRPSDALRRAQRELREETEWSSPASLG